MRLSLRIGFFIVLCGFSSLASAGVEVAVYGGLNLRKGLCLEMDNNFGNPYQPGGQYSGGSGSNCNSSYNNNGFGNYGDSYGGGSMAPQKLGDKMPLIAGGDIIYRIPEVKGLGIGIRYQYMHSPGKNNAAFFNLNPKLNAHRVAFLINYRHIFRNRNSGPFIGAILSLDIFRHAIINLYGGSSTPFSPGQGQNGRVDVQIGDHSAGYSYDRGFGLGSEFKASNWIGTGQLALEAGFKLASGLLIKFEAGYSLYSFHELESSVYAGGGGSSRFSVEEPQSGVDIDINSGNPYGSNYGALVPNMKATLSSFYIIFGIGFEI